MASRLTDILKCSKVSRGIPGGPLLVSKVVIGLLGLGHNFTALCCAGWILRGPWLQLLLWQWDKCHRWHRGCLEAGGPEAQGQQLGGWSRGKPLLGHATGSKLGALWSVSVCIRFFVIELFTRSLILTCQSCLLMCASEGGCLQLCVGFGGP